MRCLIVACVALAGCAAGETPYQTRLRYACGTSDKAACEVAKLTTPAPARPSQEPFELPGPLGFLFDVLAAIPLH